LISYLNPINSSPSPLLLVRRGDPFGFVTRLSSALGKDEREA
jgi:hypothetical protein